MTQEIWGMLSALSVGEQDSWGVKFVGSDPLETYNDLVLDLKGGRSGEGKRVVNKHRFWGLTPTLAWLLASRDPSYSLAHDSLLGFARLWDSCQAVLSEERYHYVSLGIGDGTKDLHILDRLQTASWKPFYFAVDISSHMLQLGTAESVRRYRDRVVSLQLDFERPRSLGTLRNLLSQVSPDTPALFGMLGTNLGNIDTDVEILSEISRQMRDDDRLALEVAVTTSLDPSAAQEAAAERTGSRLYNEFVTAALALHTDLTIDSNWLRFSTMVEPDTALKIRGDYTNCSDKQININLSNRETIPFPPGEAVRVLLGRKYTTKGIRGLLRAAKLVEEASASSLESDTPHDSALFGTTLVIARKDPDAAHSDPVMERLWHRVSRRRRDGIR